jgi:hypothetical protein
LRAVPNSSPRTGDPVEFVGVHPKASCGHTSRCWWPDDGGDTSEYVVRTKSTGRMTL